MKYRQLEYQDRVTIEIQLSRRANQKEIARVIWCTPWTISREIRRNGVRKRWTDKTVYLADEADTKAYQRVWRTKTQSMKINMNTQLKLFIIEQLLRKDILNSPKLIAHIWNKNVMESNSQISFMSIYKWLETSDWYKYKRYLAHKIAWYRKRKPQAHKVKIIGRVDIDERTDVINNREEQWHFEADLIVSKKGYKWVLLTLIDRKTRLPRIYKLKNKKSRPIMNIIKNLQHELWIKSVTFDNWMEFAKHYLLNDSGINTYFCKPFHSREKWSIENLNKLIRRFYSRWTIFDQITTEQIRSTCNILANTPREILGFLSPNQVHFPKT